MKKFTQSIVAIVLAAFVWTACIDDAVSPGVEALRNATAAYMNAKAALETANAAYRTAQASYQDAVTAELLISNASKEEDLRLKIATTDAAVVSAEATLEVNRLALETALENLENYLETKNLDEAVSYLNSFRLASNAVADLFTTRAAKVAAIARAEMLLNGANIPFDLLKEEFERDLAESEAKLPPLEATLVTLEGVETDPSTAQAEYDQASADLVVAEDLKDKLTLDKAKADADVIELGAIVTAADSRKSEYETAVKNIADRVISIANKEAEIVTLTIKTTAVEINKVALVVTAAATLAQREDELAAAPGEVADAAAALTAANTALTNQINASTVAANANVVAKQDLLTTANTNLTNEIASETTAAAAAVVTANATLTSEQAALAAAQSALTIANSAVTNANTILSGANSTTAAKKVILDAAAADKATKTAAVAAATATLTAAQNALDVAIADDNANPTAATAAAVTAATTVRDNANTALGTANTALATSTTAFNDADGVYTNAKADSDAAKVVYDNAVIAAAAAQVTVNAEQEDVTQATAAVAAKTALNTPAAILLTTDVVTMQGLVTTAQINLATAQAAATPAGIAALPAVITLQNTVVAAQARVAAAPTFVTTAQSNLVAAQQALAAEVNAAEDAAALAVVGAENQLVTLLSQKTAFEADVTNLQAAYDDAVANLEQYKVDVAMASDLSASIAILQTANTADITQLGGVRTALKNFIDGIGGITAITNLISKTKDDIETQKRAIAASQKALDDNEIDITEATEKLDDLNAELDVIDEDIAAQQSIAAKWFALLTANLG